MKRSAIGIAFATVLLSAASAAAQPAIIPRMANAPHDTSRTYDLVRRYLSNPQGGNMKIMSENKATHTIVAKRGGIDTQTWGEWAYCKVSTAHLLDTLKDGSATVTVKIEPVAKDSSLVKVSADFQGTYQLGSSESTTGCISNGILENDILQAVGASSQSS
jgi:hypothetical protein